jgi:hypothetical protein
MSKINIVMDMSQYDMFLLCPFRFRNRYKLNLELPKHIAKTDALDRGTLVHIACETYYESLKSGAKYDYAVNSALLKLKEAFVIESNLDNDEASHIVDTMEEYFDYWRVADQSFEILGVEEPFIYLLHEDDEVRIHLAGKIDLRIKDNKYNNQPYDHKSFSRSGPVNSLSNQFKNYCFVAESNILVVNRIGLQKSLKPHEKFLRVPVSYDHLVFESWKKNVIVNIMYYLQCEADGYWPTNETSCDKFNRRCEYYEICESSGEEAKNFKLMSNYIKVPAWDVSAVLRKSSEELELKKQKVEATK